MYIYTKNHIICFYIILTLACTKFFRCARSSIPNTENINKKYSIKTTNSKPIIYMRGVLILTRAKNEKNSSSNKTVFINFYPDG